MLLTGPCARSDWSKRMFYQSIKHRKSECHVDQFTFRIHYRAYYTHYTVIKHSGHLRILEHSCSQMPVVFYRSAIHGLSSDAVLSVRRCFIVVKLVSELQFNS